MSVNRPKLDQRLAQTRESLLTFVDQLSPADRSIVIYDDPDRWTVEDVLRHLISAEASMVRLMDGIRQGGDGAPADFDLARFNRRGVEKLAEVSSDDLLGALAETRAKTIVFMDSLDEDDWAKKGRHAVGNIWSIFEICKVIGTHERGHLRDMKGKVTRNG